MPKPQTFPTLYDDALQVSITKLKEFGYLKPDTFSAATLSWSRQGEEFASISITINTQHKQPYLELDYKFNDDPRKYNVALVSKPSNLGKGKVWYFVCPVTKKRCRKLYSVGGYFLHREAHKGCMYKSQTESKFIRKLTQRYSVGWEGREYDQLHQKHLKKHYKGKPTKRYLRIINKIEKANNVKFTTPYGMLMGEIYGF